MGSVIMRNRFWWYRSLYDEYIGREMRMAFVRSLVLINVKGLAAVLWIPHYVYGVHLNRMIERNAAHKNYQLEWGPRRNRLTHSLIFEEFEVILENWQELNREYKEKGISLVPG